MTVLRKFYEVIYNYLSSKNELDTLKHENRLTIISTVPILVLAAVINMALYPFFTGVILSETIINSTIFLLFAAVLFGTDRCVTSEQIKYNIIVAAITTLMLFIVLRFYRHIGPAVWTAGFAFILLALSRTNKKMLVSVAVTLAALGVYEAARDIPYIAGTGYYVAQFSLFLLLFLLSAAIHYINCERYKKIRHYLYEAETISEISSDFNTVSADNLDEKINGMLRKTGTYLKVDRATVFLVSKDRNSMQRGYEWCAKGIETSEGIWDEFDMASNAWAEQLVNRSQWIIPDLDALDPVQSPGKAELQALGIKAMISMPIVIKDRIYGILFYQCFDNPRDWKDEHKKMLILLSNMLADAFYKAESEKEINFMAFYDRLTGLPNRFLFNIRLEQAILESEAGKSRLAVLFIDLDSFKSVNDTTGHEGGDELLRQVAISLSERVGDLGTVSRFGGDEFIVVIPNLNEWDNIEDIARDIMQTFACPLRINGLEYFVTASAGVAVYPEDGTESNILKKNADMAMYTAKELGKNQVSFCTEKMKEDVEKKVLLTNLLYRAQQRDEFMLYYQPLINIDSEEIVGVEALLRWDNPEFGVVSPGDFIPLAEQTGLINQIGRWVLKEACRQSKRWQESGLPPVRVAVNLSVEQFHNPNLILYIREALEETGLDPAYLELEITESCAIRETNYISRVLQEIKSLGVSISIDDFGTEYSSLARIKQLPIDRIKMAMQFVHGIPSSVKDEAIAKIIINLAGSLGLKVIAEGVETKCQFEFLKNRVCDEVQGYYFYKPMPAPEVEKLLMSIGDDFGDVFDTVMVMNEKSGSLEA